MATLNKKAIDKNDGGDNKKQQLNINTNFGVLTNTSDNSVMTMLASSIFSLSLTSC